MIKELHRSGLYRPLRVCLLLLLVPFLTGSRISCLELDPLEPSVEEKPKPNGIDEQLRLQFEEIGKWSQVFVQGGAYDVNGDGYDDVRVLIDGDDVVMQTLSQGRVVEEIAYRDGFLAEKRTDSNGDGVSDTAQVLDYGEQRVTSRQVSDHDADGHIDEVVESVYVGDPLRLDEKKTKFIRTPTGATTTEEIYSISVGMDAAYDARCDGVTPPDLGGYAPALSRTPANAEWETIDIPNSGTSINVLVVSSLLNVFGKRDIPTDVADPRCTLEQKDQIFATIAKVLSKDIMCLELLRNPWANMIRLGVARNHVLFTCGVPYPLRGHTYSMAPALKTVRRKNGNIDFVSPRNIKEPGDSGVVMIGLNKDLFSYPDKGQLEATMLHEIIHATVQVTHKDDVGGNYLDGVSRRAKEGDAVDEIHACGHFCGGGHVETKFGTTQRARFFCSHDYGETDTQVFQQSLAEECARCASPDRRWWCGLKPVYNMPVSANLDEFFEPSVSPLACGEVVSGGGELSVPAGKTCGDDDGNSWTCQLGHFLKTVACDDRYIPNVNYGEFAGEGYAVDCHGSNSRMCRDRSFMCPTKCGGNVTDGIKEMSDACARNTLDTLNLNSSCRYPDMAMLRVFYDP